MQTFLQHILGSKKGNASQPSLNGAFPRPSTKRSSQSQKKTILQTDSPFFTKLPLELRLRIYEDLFGHRKVHLIWAAFQGETWHHCVCTPDCAFYHWYGWCHRKGIEEIRIRSNCSLNPQHSQLPAAPRKNQARLKLDIGMLYSCRQSYAESIFILYGTRTFDFGTEDLFRQFRLSVFPECFAAISSIDLRYHCGQRGQPHLGGSGKKNWDALWDCLGSLPRLRELRLLVYTPTSMYVWSRMSFGNYDDDWLKPLDKMEGKEMVVFDIGMPKAFFVNFRKDHSKAPYRLIELRDG